MHSIQKGGTEPLFPDEFFQGVSDVLEQARDTAYRAVNSAMVQAYWEIGRRIVRQQGDEGRAEYGKALLRELSKRLTKEFGRGFTVTNLKYMRQFYLAFPIGHALRDQLTWTHYRSLSRVTDPAARDWYMNEAADNGWSSRTLDRNISTQYYHRLLQSQTESRASVESEMRRLTAPLQRDNVPVEDE